MEFGPIYLTWELSDDDDDDDDDDEGAEETGGKTQWL